MHNMIRKISLLTTLTLGGASLGGCSAIYDEPEGTLADTTQEVTADFCPPVVPAAVVPAIDQTIDRMLPGIGVQIYICNATATGQAWTFVAPQANLVTDDGRLVGTHFIGPTWQSNNGSSVVAKRAGGETVDPTAVPWLLLTAVSHSDVDGTFSDITSIQRLSTVGGLAPSTGCDAAHLGTIAQVPYSAEYVFYKTKAQGKIKQCSGS